MGSSQVMFVSISASSIFQLISVRFSNLVSKEIELLLPTCFRVVHWCYIYSIFPLKYCRSEKINYTPEVVRVVLVSIYVNSLLK